MLVPSTIRRGLFPVLFPCVLLCAEKPRLVILLSVDQMRHDYLERYSGEFTGGFKRLLGEGVVFANADLNYASSQTGPGHASLSTGSYPRASGILENEWYDAAAQRTEYCVEDSTAQPVDGEGGNASPRNLCVSAVGDWLKQASPHSKVVAISCKNRAAVLLGGLHPDGVFWYDASRGHFVSSTYYAAHLPGWLRELNTSDWIKNSVPKAWTPLRPAGMPSNTYTGGQTLWAGKASFPHVFSERRIFEELLMSPWADEYALKAAEQAVIHERLGQREITDLLCISLSATDYVGHAFGPDSDEMHDNLLRLDDNLGKFLDEVERAVGRGKMVVVVSADHAVQRMPEFLAATGIPGSRRVIFGRELKPALQAADSALRGELGMRRSVFPVLGYLNYTEAAVHGVDSVSLERRVRTRLMTLNAVRDVFFRRELMNLLTPHREYLDRFQRSYFAPRGEDFQILFGENVLIASRATGTTHGSPYSYDTHVPLVVWGTSTSAQRSVRAVHTVDVAPTIARILDLPVPPVVDGTPLTEILYN